MEASGIQTVEKKGKSVEEAINAALEELGCELSQVSITVVEEPSRGLLGLGKKLALIRATRVDTYDENEETAVRKVVDELLGRMNLEYNIDRIESNEEMVNINLVGKDKGLLIGRKGETLNAIQYIIGLIVNRSQEKKIKIILDITVIRNSTVMCNTQSTETDSA
jgi:spoIIIJ-associated protein